LEKLSFKNKKLVRGIKKYLLITIGSIIYSAAISLFLDPNDLAPGGVSGVAILINRFINIPTGTINLILNVPIIILGLWKFGWRFICSTFYALLMTTIFINRFAAYGPVTEDLLIAAVIGGGLVGLSIAIIMKVGATTGGSDIIVKVLRTKWKHIKTNVLFLGFDCAVILASWLVFKDMTVAFYAGIAVVVDSIVIDYVLYGPDEAKVIYIISGTPQKVKEKILAELDITATIIPAIGAYTNTPKEMLMIVTRKQMAPQIEEIVKEEDRHAFMIVSSASEIFGEGYKDITRDVI
jgi:uncharacterized membrane-anchored protein YitT (DUF2179 family)